MQVLQNMDMDQFVVVVPAALVAMYALISVQKWLSFKDNPYTGLILPGICFIAATVLGFRPMFMLEAEGGLLWFCVRMWFTFNIPTVVLLFPYFKGLQNKKAMKLAMEQMASQEAQDVPEESSEK